MFSGPTGQVSEEASYRTVEVEVAFYGWPVTTLGLVNTIQRLSVLRSYISTAVTGMHRSDRQRGNPDARLD